MCRLVPSVEGSRPQSYGRGLGENRPRRGNFNTSGGVTKKTLLTGTRKLSLPASDASKNSTGEAGLRGERSLPSREPVTVPNLPIQAKVKEELDDYSFQKIGEPLSL